MPELWTPQLAGPLVPYKRTLTLGDGTAGTYTAEELAAGVAICDLAPGDLIYDAEPFALTEFDASAAFADLGPVIGDNYRPLYQWWGGFPPDSLGLNLGSGGLGNGGGVGYSQYHPTLRAWLVKYLIDNDGYGQSHLVQEASTLTAAISTNGPRRRVDRLAPVDCVRPQGREPDRPRRPRVGHPPPRPGAPATLRV